MEGKWAGPCQHRPHAVLRSFTSSLGPSFPQGHPLDRLPVVYSLLCALCQVFQQFYFTRFSQSDRLGITILILQMSWGQRVKDLNLVRSTADTWQKLNSPSLLDSELLELLEYLRTLSVLWNIEEKEEWIARGEHTELLTKSNMAIFISQESFLYFLCSEITLLPGSCWHTLHSFSYHNLLEAAPFFLLCMDQWTTDNWYSWAVWWVRNISLGV